LMPVGAYEKDDIRSMAESINARIANKPDSQEICFVEDDDYGRFIEDYTGKKIEPGNFVDMQGKVIGQHKGIIHYTVGQRKGLGLNLGRPGFVVEIKPETNEVVIGTNEDTFSTIVYADRLNFMTIETLVGQMTVEGKIRYNQMPVPCDIELVNEDLIRCTFHEQVRAATPGQALVLYDGDYVLGGGTIIKR